MDDQFQLIEATVDEIHDAMKDGEVTNQELTEQRRRIQKRQRSTSRSSIATLAQSTACTLIPSSSM